MTRDMPHALGWISETWFLLKIRGAHATKMGASEYIFG